MDPLISRSFPANDADGNTVYPDSDGQPMANNTLHLEYITTTKYGIESVFADRDDVFVAADLFWYPVKGTTTIVQSPDVMVVLGRPNYNRKSYKQWEEENIAPQVVFEYLSESNTPLEMMRKTIFFERYGVQEYYCYDIERKQLNGFIRFQESDDSLEEIADMTDWRSPRLGICFDMSSGVLQLYKPDGEPFLSYLELDAILKNTTKKLEKTENLLEHTQSKLAASENRTETLEAKLRELGINPNLL